MFIIIIIGQCTSTMCYNTRVYDSIERERGIDDGHIVIINRYRSMSMLFINLVL